MRLAKPGPRRERHGVFRGCIPSASIYPTFSRVFSKLAFRKRPSSAARACSGEGRGFFDFAEGVARHLLIGHELVPICWPVEGSHARTRVHPLIRPERPAHIVPLEREPEAPDPIIGILAGFSEKNRNVVRLREFQMLREALL